MGSSAGGWTGCRLAHGCPGVTSSRLYVCRLVQLSHCLKSGVGIIPISQMRKQFREAGRGVEGSVGVGGQASVPQPTCSPLHTVGTSLPDATALGTSPFGPQLWDH